MNTLSPIVPNLQIQNAQLSFQGRTLFQDLNLNLPSQHWMSLLGTSGVGKTSLLRLIAHLDTPNTLIQGKISCDNGIPAYLQISYMAQTDLLLPWLNVLDNALLGTRLRASNPEERAEQTEKALHLLTRTGLENAIHLYPHQLSGGMRQRVALVRTLLENQAIVLMDEPFSALDAITRFQLQDLAAELLQERSVLFITHDPQEALRLSDQIVILSGSPASISQSFDCQTATPRSLDNAEVLNLQPLLFKALLNAHGVPA